MKNEEWQPSVVRHQTKNILPDESSRTLPLEDFIPSSNLLCYFIIIPILRIARNQFSQKSRQE